MEPVVKEYFDSADAVKLLLMPFVCCAIFGLPGHIGNYVANLCRFAAYAFFILCGFFSAESDDVGSPKTVNTLRRTGMRFVFLFVLYFVINFLLYTLGMGVSMKGLLSALLHKRVFFEVIVLCMWPFNMGKSVWFIQSLFYIRILLWLMKKYRLLRFYKLLMVIGILAMLFTSELAAVIGFNFVGYPYIPANWLTCALPNMMLGRLVYEKRSKLLALPKAVYPIGFVLGTALAFMEFTLLKNNGYLVHMGNAVGFYVMALSVCCWTFRTHSLDSSPLTVHGRAYSWSIYALCQPVALFMVILAANTSDELLSTVQNWGGPVIYFGSLLVAIILGYLSFLTEEFNDSVFIRKWNRWLN